MRRLAPGVWRVAQFPGPWVNVYLVEDVLVDAGARLDRRRIFKRAGSRSPATPTTSMRWRDGGQCRRRSPITRSTG